MKRNRFIVWIIMALVAFMLQVDMEYTQCCLDTSMTNGKHVLIISSIIMILVSPKEFMKKIRLTIILLDWKVKKLKQG